MSGANEELQKRVIVVGAGPVGLITALRLGQAGIKVDEMFINEQKPLTLLDIYSDERRRVFQMFVDPITMQNKLRCANDPETATEDWFLRALNNAPPHKLVEFAKPYFEVWPTSMRKVVATWVLG